MKPELEKLCADYIANRDTVGKVFKWDSNDLYTVCANVFCACGQTADTDRLKECREVIKKHTGLFSKFRSKKVRSILASMLSLVEKPEERMTLANDYFSLLKRHFKGTEYLVLTAFLLADLADQTLTEETALRGKQIYRRMNQKHRILTNKTDSVFAMLMAFSGKSEDELTEEVEAGYLALKKHFSNSGASQTAAQVFSMTGGLPEEKAQRLNDLYDALTEAEIKYGHADELAPLAALSLSDTPIPTLVEDIKEADEFLKDQKGYGTKEDELKKRALHAVMIVSDQYQGTDQVNVTLMTNTLDMLFAKQQASRFSFAVHVVEALLKMVAASHEGKEETKVETDNKSDAQKQPEE